METCLICERFEYEPPKGVNYVCSRCTTRLLGTPKEERRKALRKIEPLKNRRRIAGLKIFAR